MSDTSRIEQLEAKIEHLSAIIDKQSKIIAKTGEKLLTLELKDIKAKLNSSNTPQSTTKLDLDDYVTNEDVVQLVTELQGQLDQIEDRSVIRLFNNSAVNEDNDTLEILSNKDGEIPDFEGVPTTLGEFKQLSNVDLIQLGLFYEVIFIPQENQPSQDPDQIVQQSKPGSKELKNHIDQILTNFSNEDYITLFDDLARYFGLKYRKGGI
ncbi:hypothetical protein DFJ63DRAFT_312810 [Scheffersomyces coipomensis]|uniref:uncharacterized protein n=1 Tax=Scheffersomyces coipomensis TaxID=1788519 RepID=UPI00315D5DEC